MRATNFEKIEGGLYLSAVPDRCLCCVDSRLIPETRMKAYKQPRKTIPRIENENHEQNWIDACKGNTKALSNFDYAGPFTETVLPGNLAIWFAGQELMWDGPNMRVTNVPEANDLVKSTYRSGWSLTDFRGPRRHPWRNRPARSRVGLQWESECRPLPQGVRGAAPSRPP